MRERAAVEHDALRSFYAWRYYHPHQAEDPLAAWQEAWKRGAWDAIRSNATLGLNLAQILKRLEELHDLYADVDLQRRMEAECETGSPLWKAEP